MERPTYPSTAASVTDPTDSHVTESFPGSRKEFSVAHFRRRAIGSIRRSVVLVAGFVAAFAAVRGPAPATAEEIRIYGGINSADSVLEDLELVVSKLAGQPGVFANQIFPNIDIFLVGVDRENPIRFDSILGKTGQRRLSMMVPIADEKDFLRDNLDPIGITARKKGGGLYQLGGGVFDGALRVVNVNGLDYAIFGAEGFESDADFPVERIASTNKDLLFKKFDAAALIDAESGPFGQRGEIADALRDDALGALSKRPDETTSAFKLRKLLIENRFERLKSILVGGERIFVGYSTKAESQTGEAKFEITARPDTTLAKAVDTVGETPAKFIGVPTIDDPVATARMAVPLYEERRKRYLDVTAASREVTLERIANSDDSDALKAARKKLLGLVYDQMVTGADQELISGFYEVRAADSGNSVAAGVTTIDGLKVNEILDAFPDAIEGGSVEKDVEKIGEIAVHKVSVPELAAPFKKHLGGVTDVYIGVEADAVYFAGGPAGLELLKTSLDGLEPTTSTKAMTLRMHLGPMAQLIDEVMTNRNFSLIEFLQDRRNDRLEASDRDPDDVRRVQVVDPAAWRKAALDALVGKSNDVITMEIEKAEEKLVGQATFDSAILTAAGELIAKFAKENL